MQLGQKFYYKSHKEVFCALFIEDIDENHIRAIIVENYKWEGMKVKIKKQQII